MSAGDAKKIVIAGRSPLYREGLKIVLSADKAFRFSEAGSLKELVKCNSQADDPGLIILDWSLFRSEEPNLIISFIFNSVAPVLLLCNQPDRFVCQKAKSYGVRGMICKTSSGTDIRRAAKAILENQSVWPEEGKLSLRIGDAEIANKRVIERMQSLTPKERVVLDCLREGALYKQIAYQLGVQDSTVKCHAASIMRKMCSRNRTHLISLLHNVVPQYDQVQAPASDA